ncbi:hypothetical protein H0O00_00125 [Candidatus Micrarchaeota archaeon]|nr:hypothetical protein [Candidatus Micrarchaeota archaeon]
MELMDTVTLVNFLLCAIILATGYFAYKKSKDVMPLCIGVAFGFFAVSNMITLAGMAESLSSMFIIIRILAYITVLYALYAFLSRPAPASKPAKVKSR